MNTGGTIDQLTERERQVFLMVVDGLTNSAIADRLQISRRTVETHIRTVREDGCHPAVRAHLHLSTGAERTTLPPRQDVAQGDAADASLVRPAATAGRPRRHDAAFQLITGLVEVEHSWELVLDILRVGEILGRPTEALRYAAVVEDALDGQPVSFGVERAIWFYRGRILYHLGLYRYAMDFYRRNIPDGESGLGDPYQRSSRQALAHLFFRVEAFRRAETELGRLYDELTEVLDPDLRFVADVLQYRATLSSICLVHDLPFSEASGMPLDVNATEHFGAEALSISEAADDREGVSWAHTALAFAAEARQNCRRADQEYVAARQCLSDPKTRSSSKVHMLLYQAGFERRRGNYPEAEDALAEAMTWVPADPSLLLRPRVLEQFAELERVRTRDDRAGRDYLDDAMRLYAHERELILFSDWPIVLRLRRTCRNTGLDFGSYFQLSGAPHE